MKGTIWLRTLSFGALVALVAGSARSIAAETRLKEDKSLRQADAAWSKVAATKDVDAIISYYAEDATLFPANAPLAKGKEEIKKAWTDLVSRPGFTLSWEPTTALASKSGDLGYTSGAYQLSMTGPDGKPFTDKGKYVEVWKKNAAGKWKVIADIFNSDLPPPAPPKQG